ncbi:general substrate transporter [Umbelopsis sp. PMI_123]|nr:general substrate transporter [Umbelopsis sp. PMI_123]
MHVSNSEATMLRDIIPKRDKMWWHYPALRTLNLLLICAIITDVTNGYDGSMLNGLQIIEDWQTYFNNPSGSILGVISNGTRFGQIGSLFVSATLIQRFGRRRPIAIGSAILMLGVILQTAAQNTAMFVVGRVLIGFGNGIQTTACPILVSELSYPSQRTKITGFMNSTGSLGSLLAAAITFGTATMTTSSWSWRLPSLLQALSSIVQFTLSFYVPESPRWLVHNNRREEAWKILVKYHAEGDEDSELLKFQMDEIDEAIAREKAQALTSWMEWFRTSGNRHRFFIVLTVGFLIQWCGNALISYYLHLVLISIGITNTTTQLIINLFINVNGLFFGILFSFFIDRFGRRPMFFMGLSGMFCAFLILTILTAINQNTNYANPAVGQASVAMIFLFGAFYKMPGPMCPSYVAEVSPYDLRAKAFVVNGFADAAANVFNGFANPVALAAIKWKYYIVWCCLLITNMLLVYFFYPETKGLSLEEVSTKFDKDEHDFETAEAMDAQMDEKK